MAQLQATSVNGVLTSLRTENIQTGNYSIALLDRNRVVAMNNTSAVTVTIPADATINFPVGSLINIARINTGAVTLVAAGGVTVSKTGALGSNEEIILRKRGANNWAVAEERQHNLTGIGGSVAASGNFRVHSYTTGTGTFIVQS